MSYPARPTAFSSRCHKSFWKEKLVPCLPTRLNVDWPTGNARHYYKVVPSDSPVSDAACVLEYRHEFSEKYSAYIFWIDEGAIQKANLYKV
jgi:hypothetical protein